MRRRWGLDVSFVGCVVGGFQIFRIKATSSTAQTPAPRKPARRIASNIAKLPTLLFYYAENPAAAVAGFPRRQVAPVGRKKPLLPEGGLRASSAVDAHHHYQQRLCF